MSTSPVFRGSELLRTNRRKISETNPVQAAEARKTGTILVQIRGALSARTGAGSLN